MVSAYLEGDKTQEESCIVCRSFWAIVTQKENVFIGHNHFSISAYNTENEKAGSLYKAQKLCRSSEWKS